jgi:hypothetical protein
VVSWLTWQDSCSNAEHPDKLSVERRLSVQLKDFSAEQPDTSSEVNWLLKHIIDSKDLLFDT